MTVTMIDVSGKAYCSWFEGVTAHDAVYPVAALTLKDPWSGGVGHADSDYDPLNG
jgi:hypothetical protein